MKNKDMYILIVENEALGKQLIKDHLNKSDITYAQLLKEKKRQEAVDKLAEIDE